MSNIIVCSMGLQRIIIQVRCKIMANTAPNNQIYLPATAGSTVIMVETKAVNIYIRPAHSNSPVLCHCSGCDVSGARGLVLGDSGVMGENGCASILLRSSRTSSSVVTSSPESDSESCASQVAHSS